MEAESCFPSVVRRRSILKGWYSRRVVWVGNILSLLLVWLIKGSNKCYCTSNEKLEQVWPQDGGPRAGIRYWGSYAKCTTRGH